jgi:hypothetical protein
MISIPQAFHTTSMKILKYDVHTGDREGDGMKQSWIDIHTMKGQSQVQSEAAACEI